MDRRRDKLGRVPRKTKKAMKCWPRLTPAGHARVNGFFNWFLRAARRRYGATLDDLQSGKYLDKMP